MLHFNRRLCARGGPVTAMFHTTGRLLKAASAGAASTSASAAADVASATKAQPSSTVQVATPESALPPDPVMDGLPPLPEPPLHQVRPFPHKGPRGNFTPEYYVGTAGAAGHPDLLAEQLGAGRPDSEWMWLKLLCFICFMSTIGTWVYGVFFPQHAKFFQDEPWSRLPKSAL